MQTRSRTIKKRSGHVIYLMLAENSGPANNNGNNAVINIIIIIIMLNAMIRYLNFNRNTPIINYW
jgi:hypothetical protein